MKPDVRMHKASFSYGSKEVIFSFWSNTSNDTRIDTIVFLGSGQVGKVPKWVAESAPAGTVVVDGLPHWFAHPSARDLKEFSKDYTVAAFQAVLKTFGLSSAHIVASSQAAPGAIGLAQHIPDKVGNIALITPLGFTAMIFGDSATVRLKKLKRRSFATLFQFAQLPFHDIRNFYIYLLFLRAVLSESQRGATDNKYATGLSYDLLEDCRMVADEQKRKRKSFTVFLGEKDKIFPPHEVITSLKNAGLNSIKTVILPGVSHSSLAIRSSKEVLTKIINEVRKK